MVCSLRLGCKSLIGKHLYSVLLVVSQNAIQRKWEEIILRIDGSCDEDAPLHLNIKAYLSDIDRGDAQQMILNIAELRKILMPCPWYLKSIDSDGKRPFAEVRADVVRREALILNQNNEDLYQLLDALDMYESFYYANHGKKQAHTNVHDHFFVFNVLNI